MAQFGTTADILIDDKPPEGTFESIPRDDPIFFNVGRNDPCPCGSGKKYKRCHGA